jgi:hypothetical protein
MLACLIPLGGVNGRSKVIQKIFEMLKLKGLQSWLYGTERLEVPVEVGMAYSFVFFCFWFPEKLLRILKLYVLAVVFVFQDPYV